MVNIRRCWEGSTTQLLDQAAPILEKLKEVLGHFEEPEVGYVHKATGVYIQLSSRELVIDQEALEVLLQAAKSSGAKLSIDTRDGPLMVTIIKHKDVF